LDAVIITGHLTWSDRNQRAKERRLLACVAKKALEIDPDVIVAGDFNTTGAPGDTIEELATAAGLRVLLDGTADKLPTTYSGNYYDYILVAPDLYSEESTQYLRTTGYHRSRHHR
jgi:endonuclease/exonuclease/phosphatase family metal-dependent hydrolase